MAVFLAKVRRLERRFIGFEVKHVPRKDNFLADELTRLASSREPVLIRIFEERLTRPSTAVSGQGEGDAPFENEALEAMPLEVTPPSMPSTTGGHHVVTLLDSGTTWMDQILNYLQN